MLYEREERSIGLALDRDSERVLTLEVEERLHELKVVALALKEV